MNIYPTFSHGRSLTEILRLMDILPGVELLLYKYAKKAKYGGIYLDIRDSRESLSGF